MRDQGKNNNKDVVIFLIVLAVIGAGFVIGTRYIKGDVAVSQSGSGLLADASAELGASQISSSTAAASSAVTSTAAVASPAANPSGGTITYTTSNIAPPIVPFVSTPSSTSVWEVSTSTTPTPAAPKPAPPAPAPKPAPVALTLPYTETNFTDDANWAKTWGSISTDSSGLLYLGTAPSGTGFGVHLNNSENWTDYKFTASLDWVGGRSLSITARYHDDGDLVLCNYYEEAKGSYIISLQQFIKGKELTLAQSDPIILNDATARPNTTVSIEVDNVNGWCSLDDYVISNSVAGGGTYLINAPYNGGIGLTMWDSTPNASKVIINSVNVIQE